MPRPASSFGRDIRARPRSAREGRASAVEPGIIGRRDSESRDERVVREERYVLTGRSGPMDVLSNVAIRTSRGERAVHDDRHCRSPRGPLGAAISGAPRCWFRWGSVSYADGVSAYRPTQRLRASQRLQRGRRLRHHRGVWGHGALELAEQFVEPADRRSHRFDDDASTGHRTRTELT